MFNIYCNIKVLKRKQGSNEAIMLRWSTFNCSSIRPKVRELWPWQSKSPLHIPNQDLTRPEMMSALSVFLKKLFFTLHFSQNLQVQTQNGYSSTNSFLFNMFHFCNLYVKLIFFGATVETHSQIFNDYEFHFAVKKTRYVNLSKLHI